MTTAVNRHPDPPRPRMIGALLRVPFQETVRRVSAELARAGFIDLRPALLVVFQHLEPGGTRQTELAERAQMTKQAMGYLVRYLEEHGYVELVPDPRDRRARLVRLTDRGRAVDAAARAALARLEAEWAARLGEARYRQLRDALRELADEIEPAPGG